jgi:hypothetical protein
LHRFPLTSYVWLPYVRLCSTIEPLTLTTQGISKENKYQGPKQKLRERPMFKQLHC